MAPSPRADRSSSVTIATDIAANATETSPSITLTHERKGLGQGGAVLVLMTTFAVAVAIISRPDIAIDIRIAVTISVAIAPLDALVRLLARRRHSALQGEDCKPDALDDSEADRHARHCDRPHPDARSTAALLLAAAGLVALGGILTGRGPIPRRMKGARR